MSMIAAEESSQVETYRLVWLDDDIHADSNKTASQMQLRQITDQINIFDDCDACVDYLTDADESEKIILIISGRFGHRVVPCIHDFQPLLSIYVYCVNKQANKQWSQHYHKVKSICTTADELINQLKRDQHIYEEITHDTLTITIYKNDQRSGGVLEQRDSRNAMFMFFQLFIEILLKMPRNETKAKEELISAWRQAVGDSNTTQQAIIEDFSKNYQPDDAIRWYTRESFIYRVLNKALRDHDIDLLFAMRFFITDLYQKLSREHQQQFHHSHSILHVYRGQAISSAELSFIRQSVGEYISFNRQTANRFAKSNTRTIEGMERVLFQVEVNTNLETVTPFANIKQLSNYRGEEEVLIAFGSIFRIEQIKYDGDEQLWIAKLILCSQNDYELKELLTQMRKEATSDSVVSLGWLLYRQAKYGKAKEYFEQLLTKPSTSPFDQALCYRGLGLISFALKKYDEALIYHQKELDLLINLHCNDEGYALVYLLMGQNYLHKKEPDLALEYEQKALEKLPHTNYRELSNLYGIMGNIYVDKCNYDLAIKYYEKSLKMDRKHLPTNHENVGVTYSTLGTMYFRKGDYQQALVHFIKAQEIFIKCLPANHPNVGDMDRRIRFLKAHLKRE